VLEAKLSHDLAYYRFFDAVAELAEKAGSLARLIGDLRELPRDATPATTDKHLRALAARYAVPAK
jgi:hypothetical protein